MCLPLSSSFSPRFRVYPLFVLVFHIQSVGRLCNILRVDVEREKRVALTRISLKKFDNERNTEPQNATSGGGGGCGLVF